MSYRPSLHPGSSTNGGFSSVSSQSQQASPLLARALLDKQREYTAFHTVALQSQQLATFLNTFADKYDVLDGGSEGAFRRFLADFDEFVW